MKKTHELYCNLFVCLNISACTRNNKTNQNTAKLIKIEEKTAHEKEKNLNRSPQRSRFRSSYPGETYSQHEVPFKATNFGTLSETQPTHP